jgi:hypothetical protein
MTTILTKSTVHDCQVVYVKPYQVKQDKRVSDKIHPSKSPQEPQNQSDRDIVQQQNKKKQKNSTSKKLGE